MNSIVCCKQVPDPEAPSEYFKIDSDRNQLIPSQALRQVINPFDENAVEAALRIKDQHGGKVTIVFMGDNFGRDVVKKPLSMGADELVLLEGEVYEGGDSWSTAYALTAAINKIGEYDLIFCGRQASDWDAGQVGSGIAEMLGIPSVTLAKKVEVLENKARVERVIEDGYQVVEVSIPALITVSNELGEPRFTTLKGIMESNKKQPTIWKPQDLGIDESRIGASGRLSNLVKLSKPARDVECEFIDADTIEEAGGKLAHRLKEMALF